MITDQEKHQALERYLSWKDHPYTKLYLEILDREVNNLHLRAENSNDNNIKLLLVEEARVVRRISDSMKQPLVIVTPVVNNNNNNEQE